MKPSSVFSTPGEAMRLSSFAMASSTAPGSSGTRSSRARRQLSTLIGSTLVLSAVGVGCTDDDDTQVSAGAAGTAGATGAAGTAGAAGAPSIEPPPAPEVDAGRSDAGSAVDRDVFRPEERPYDATLAASLRVPSGFVVSTFATDVDNARMLVARGSSLYVTRPELGDVLRLEDADADGTADGRTTVISGLPLVHGIAFRENQVYLATPNQVLLASVDGNGAFGAAEVIIGDLPDGGQHPLRTLGISPDDRLFISVGSTCDACDDSNPENATMLVAGLDGTGRSTFASGLRNTIGFGWHPTTAQLWGMDHGSDWRGGNTPPEELNAIAQGADYGWPYCYGDRVVDPVIQDPPEGTKAEYCADTSGPALSTQAHNAPIGLAFYTGTSFPTEYRDDAFVAMHGSWNRYPPTGYKVVRVVFEAGVPQGFEDFVTGFLIDDGAATFGRPAGITIAPDGSVLFSDDTSGAIYRVRYGEGVPDAGVPVIIP